MKHPSIYEELVIVLSKLAFIIIGTLLIYFLVYHVKTELLLPQSIAVWLVLATPTLIIGWIALHIGLFIFRTIFPR